MVTYTIPRAWGAALAATRFDGVVANLRSSRGRSVGLALFGKAGERTAWPDDDKPTRATAVVARMQLTLIEAPSLRGLTIATPPRSGPPAVTVASRHDDMRVVWRGRDRVQRDQAQPFGTTCRPDGRPTAAWSSEPITGLTRSIPGGGIDHGLREPDRSPI
jgi:hypothetical protein